MHPFPKLRVQCLAASVMRQALLPQRLKPLLMRLKVCVRPVDNGDLWGCSWNSTVVRQGYTSTPVLLGDWLRTRLIPRVSTASSLTETGHFASSVEFLSCHGVMYIRVRSIDVAATHQHDDVSLSSDLQRNLRLFVTAGQTAAATGSWSTGGVL